MKQKTGRKLLSFLLALALVVGLVPGMGLRAYAAGGGTEVTKANVICQQYSYMDADYYSSGVLNDTPPADITNITLADAQAFGAAVNCPTTYWVVVYATDGDNLKWTSNGKTGEQTSTPRSASGRVLSAWCQLYNDDVFHFGGNYDPMRDVTFYFSKGLATVSVTGVSLDKTTAQTIDVDGKVSFTATVAPDNATDKKVKWNVGGTDTGAVKLYSDEACTTEVGADAIETLTVYAKGISAGSATVTATSNADSEKKASCDVTVNAAQTQTETLLTTITATGKEQASYSTENVATVSFSYTANGYSSYTNNGKVNWGWWGYGWSATVNAAEGYTITKCVFYDDKDRTATDSEAPFVVETTEEDKTPKVNGTPILANTSKGITKIEVYGYATPAATHSVTITPGSNMTKTAGSGDAEQTGLSGAMTDVVYTANDGYKFPETNDAYTTTNGITVAVSQDLKTITVSGTPTANTEITIPDAVEDTASDDPYAELLNTTTAVNFDGKEWYLIENNSTAVDAGTVTLLSKECVAASQYNSSGSYVEYASSTVKTAVDNWYNNNITSNAKTAVFDNKMFLLTKDQANAMTTDTRKCSQASEANYNYWWLCSPGSFGNFASCVYGGSGNVLAYGYSVVYALGVRPALKLNLSSVIFSSESKTFTVGSAASYSVIVTAGSNMTKTETSGAASQTDLSGTMTDVVYTADDGYYFPTDYSVATVNGISVTRNSYTQITVSGTPTADASITLTAPTAKTTPDAPTTVTVVNCTTADNNDGKLTGVTAAMEYKKSDAESWTAGTGSDITGLVPGTYYVRVKATDTTNASGNQELTIADYLSVTKTAAKADLDTLQSGKNQDDYDAADWTTLTQAITDGKTAIDNATTIDDVATAKSNAETAANAVKTTAEKKEEADTAAANGVSNTINNLPAANEVTTANKNAIEAARAAYNALTDDQKAYVSADTLKKLTDAEDKLVIIQVMSEVSAKTGSGMTYTGNPIQLINTPTTALPAGYTMQYAVTTENTAPTDASLYTTSIPTATNTGTYYVWYKVVGDENHNDTEAVCVTASIQRRSSGGGSSTTTVTVPVTSDTATGSVPVTASVSGTTATVTKLTDEQITQVTTNKSGNKDADAETETNSVVIDVSGVAKDVKTATIPTETVKAVEETGSNLKVTLTDGSVEFDATAQAIITDEAKGTTIQVNLDAVKVTTLTSAQQSAVESLEVEVVLDAYVTSNGQRISDFKGGSATLSVPYTLKDGQAAQGIVVWYVASDGTRTQVDASYDGKNVVFTVPHFSNYVIAYDAAKAAACPQDTTCPISAFTDARTTAWYHDGVHWAIENSVMNGVGDGKFAPNGITTRAQVVTMLWRLEGSPAYVGMSEFDDGRFGANDAVTREQLVTILYRYAQYKKMDVSVGEDTNILSYDDAFDVSEWAIPAMQWACGSGIVNGIDKNGTLMLAPSDASTRAVVATMFWRFSK